MKKRKIDQNTKLHMKRAYIEAMILVLCLCILGISSYYIEKTSKRNIASAVFVDSGYPILDADIRQKLGLENYEKEVSLAEREAKINSFLQGPKSWEGQVTWSGEWATAFVNGNCFGGFGCGLCCMANIYNTLSPYEGSPLEMCDFTMTHTGYSPTKKVGAIGWGEMKYGLRAVGVDCELYEKPATYEEFQTMMGESQSMVVLVSSANDTAFWKDTPGHYVNIWLYDEEGDTVFLAEPGSPTNNRSRIPLKYVYDALKTVSKFQILCATGYQEANDQWKHHGIGGNWCSP